jgi:hypothetical protein
MNTYRLYQAGRWVMALWVVLSLSALMMGALVVAQEPVTTPEDEFADEPIELTAAITSIGEDFVIIGGLPVDLSLIDFEVELVPGTVVTINGVINEIGVITATTIVIIGFPTPTPSPTPSPTAEPQATATPTATVAPGNLIIIEGPVTSINMNVLTIRNVTVIVAPNNPVLNLIRVGDVIRVEGVGGPNGINALVVNTVINTPNAAPGASVSVQGPIEAINGNIITVNGILIQLNPNDPRLNELEVGNFVDVQGNFVQVDNSFVLMSVNLAIINNSFVGIPPYCRWHGMSGMGHWRCDGYWLYPPGFWHCEWRAMGMGRWECVEPIPAMGMSRMGGMGMGMGMGMGG